MDTAREFKRGSRVFANTTDGRVELMVWDDLGDAVLVCSEAQFDALKKGLAAPMPIGFPKSEVGLA